MAEAKYDQIDAFYVEFIQRGLQFPTSVVAVSAARLLQKIVAYPESMAVLDLACGEGHLTQKIAKFKERIIGVDISEKLLLQARERCANQTNAIFIQDDAHRLANIETNSIDTAVCNMAVMDIPDIKATFDSVQRVFKKRRSVFDFYVTPLL